MKSLKFCDKYDIIIVERGWIIERRIFKARRVINYEK